MCHAAIHIPIGEGASLMMKTGVYAGSALLLLAAVAVQLRGRFADTPRERPAFVLPAHGSLTLAAAGDIVISRPLAREDRDAAFQDTARIVGEASIAVANLEMNLLAPERAETARRQPGRRWTFGTAREAADLESIGFDVLGQANNHALDYGTDGMSDTRMVLTAAGLMTAGSGSDLGEARAPLVVGDARRAIAILAVAISSSSADVATPRRAGSNGWPGINALTYRAQITADAETYATLRRAAGAEGAAETDQFTLQGTVVRKAAETSVTLAPDAGDVSGILAAIANARAAGGVVVVSLHSHEPSDRSPDPADFVRVFARQAIDAGARLVVGHGPHRLRGVEVYRGGAILYSLGNFLYRVDEGHPPAADAFDAGVDMFSLAMGMSGASATAPGDDADAWWEGALAVATFDGDRLAALQLHPVDLGRQLPSARRGIPRRPALPDATNTLETLVRLSRPFGTTIQIDDGVGYVRID
jgi:poly-gamma-glutamate synthesis protein (capsule biosynthesis protein)